jgi:hypothetical protein
MKALDSSRQVYLRPLIVFDKLKLNSTGLQSHDIYVYASHTSDQLTANPASTGIYASSSLQDYNAILDIPSRTQK